MKRTLLILGMAVALVGFMGLGSAQAAPLTSFNGSLWYSGTAGTAISMAAVNPDTTAQNGLGAASNTFNVNNLNFNSNNQTTPETYLTWLQNPTAVNNSVTNWVGPDEGTNIVTGPSSPSAPNTTAGQATMFGSFLRFTGTSYFTPGEQITVTSDDGFSLAIAGIGYADNANASPQSATTVNLTLGSGFTAGNYSFAFNYGAVNGYPEVFQVSGLQAPVPEPSTLLLFGLGLLGIGLVGLKRRQQA